MPYQFITKAKLPTRHGEFDIHVFENEAGQEHVMLTVGLYRSDEQPSNPQPASSTTASVLPLVRIHSECLTGDAFDSLKCDCGPQLEAAMVQIQASGIGAILYLRQEGRGIGLTNKIRAYALQDQGHDTVDANLLLGLPEDARTYEMCETMLKSVGIHRLKLMTNNPHKLAFLSQMGFEVVERVPLLIGVTVENEQYLQTKRARMGHLLPDTLMDTVPAGLPSATMQHTLPPHQD